MDSSKKSFLTGLFYIFISIFETAESILPWVQYCKIEFSFISTHSLPDGLSYNQSKFQYYGMLKENLCGNIKPIVENVCPELCTNIENIQNAGLLLLSCNIICIILHLFLAYSFISKSKQKIEREISGLACWIMAIIKVTLGIIYFEVAGIKKIKTTWKFSFDVFLSFGFYFYFLAVFGEIFLAYFVYNFKTFEIRQQNEGKLSS